MREKFFYEMRADENYRFNLMHYDITKETPKRDDTPHYHQALEFVYVVKGNFPVHIDGEERILHTGEIAYVRPGLGHYYTSDGDANVFVLIISKDFLDNPLFEGKCILPTFMTLSNLKRNVMTQFLYTLMDIWSLKNPVLNLGIFSTFYGLLAEDYFATDKDGIKIDFPLIGILKYINEHYMEQISLKSLAKQYNYSETYFSACFNALMNIPLREYINRVRIQHVNAYIESGLTKSQAAVLCGYTNNNTFYRAFKKFHNAPVIDIPAIPYNTEE